MTQTKPTNFVHLHVHSHFSLLDGLAKPSALVAKAKQQGSPALALTDHGVMYGAIEFYKACKDAGIKPLVGCEVYVARGSRHDKRPGIDIKPYHLILIAKNFTGYQNLIQLTTIAHLEGFYYKPRVDLEILEKYKEGLVCSSACVAGEIPQLLLAGEEEKAKEVVKRFQGFYGKDSFFLEIQNHPREEENMRAHDLVRKLARKMQVPLVATCDTHYLNKEDAIPHDVLLSVQTQTTIENPNRLTLLKFDLWLKENELMIEEFADDPDAIENTLKVADMCNLEIPLKQNLLPRYTPPFQKTPKEYIRELCLEGLKKRYSLEIKEGKAKVIEDRNRPDSPENICQRLEYELGVIDKMGFNDYFLIVWDFVNWAKTHDVMVGPGRGSAGGSIVAYTLEITDVEPLAYGLLFERFLNPDRISMPDIDMDFADTKREDVLNYVVEKYGKHNVAQIITFGTMAARAAVRDTGRALGMAYTDVDRVAKMIPFVPGQTIDKGLEESAEFKAAYDKEPETKRLVDMAKHLEGVARHAGTHAAGVVISEKPLTEYTPLQNTAKEDGPDIQTQYEMHAVEDIGLLKMDFLGLRNLSVLQKALKIIKRTKQVEIDINNLPLDDFGVYKLFQKGETLGIFQFDTSGMRRYLKELKPTEFNDLIAMAALYRPGPLNTGMTDQYIRRKNGKEKVEYIHDSTKNALKDTYGVIVYQEQVMQLSRDMAGFTGGEGDTLRKAMGKKIAELMEKMKVQFINGSEKNKIPKKVAEEVWRRMEEFAKYGFNKSHAACYAMIAYQTAYLRVHFPTEYMAALLASFEGKPDRIAEKVVEVTAAGIVILPPDINESLKNFTVVEKGKIRFGLAAIKNVGEGPSDDILKARKEGPFQDITDFARRVSPRVLNKKTLEALVMCGALDSLGERNMLLQGTSRIGEFARRLAGEASSGQTSLFGETEKEERLSLDNAPPVEKKQKLDWEKELLGMYISEHPAAILAKEWEGKVTKIQDLREKDEGKSKKILGVISAIRLINTRGGEKMAFVKIEDPTGQAELVAFPRLLKEQAALLQLNQAIIVEGKINFKEGAPKILPDKVKDAHQKESDQPAPLSHTSGSSPLQLQPEGPFIIKLPKGITSAKIKQIQGILQIHRGQMPVILELDGQKVQTNYRVFVSQDLKAAIGNLLDGGKDY